MPGIPLPTLLRLLRRSRDRAEATELSDGNLLKRFADEGDETAFEVLVWRHGPLVLGLCRRLLPCPGDVDDVFQATFLTLVQKAGSIRRSEALGSWLYQVAYRLALRVRRAAARRRRRESVLGEREERSEPDVGLTDEVRTALDDEVSRLPEKYRAAVVLCYLEGRTTAEAAQLLGCPRGTILSRLAWARERLRVRLTRRGLAPDPLLVVGPTLALPGKTLVTAVVRAALPSTAGGAAVSPQVAALTRGALQAMFLTRLQLVAAVVLVLGLAGGGAGWLALRPAGAEPPPARAAKEPRTPTLTRDARTASAAAEADDAVKRARAELEKAQRQADDLEAVQLEEIVQARLRLAEAEMGVREKEREHARKREQETAHWKRLLEQLKEVEAARDRLQTVTPDPYTDRLKDLQKRLQVAEQEGVLVEQSRAQESLDRRKKLIVAEEKLRFLERRQAGQRERARAREDEAAERLRQLRGGLPRSEPGDQRLRALEQKVDRMLGELADLRRELDRRPVEREQ